MTIARDTQTGAVVGQVTAIRNRPEYGSGRPAAECMRPWKVVLLARDGEYLTVDASSVRLEELR